MHWSAMSPAAVPTHVDISKPITDAICDQVLYRFPDAKAQGNRMTIRVQALNRGQICRSRSAPCLGRPLLANERGEAYIPQEVWIANTRANAGKTRAMLIAGVPAEIRLVYSDLPMAAGSLRFLGRSLLCSSMWRCSRRTKPIGTLSGPDCRLPSHVSANRHKRWPSSGRRRVPRNEDRTFVGSGL